MGLDYCQTSLKWGPQQLCHVGQKVALSIRDNFYLAIRSFNCFYNSRPGNR